MTDIAHSAQDMISGMTPVLLPGTFVFVTTRDVETVAALFTHVVSVFREDEGISLILPLDVARDWDFDISSAMCCITLNVYSSLQGVGLTAAVATELSKHGIACNMVAAFHHDHVFVPANLGAAALDALRALQSKAIGTGRQGSP